MDPDLEVGVERWIWNWAKVEVYNEAVCRYNLDRRDGDGCKGGRGGPGGENKV